MYVLTGMVYACGDNSEGALGVDDIFARPYFTPVVWQQQHLQQSASAGRRSSNDAMEGKHTSHHPFIVKIAAAVCPPRNIAVHYIITLHYIALHIIDL